MGLIGAGATLKISYYQRPAGRPVQGAARRGLGLDRGRKKASQRNHRAREYRMEHEQNKGPKQPPCQRLAGLKSVGQQEGKTEWPSVWRLAGYPYAKRRATPFYLNLPRRLAQRYYFFCFG